MRRTRPDTAERNRRRANNLTGRRFGLFIDEQGATVTAEPELLPEQEEFMLPEESVPRMRRAPVHESQKSPTDAFEKENERDDDQASTPHWLLDLASESGHSTLDLFAEQDDEKILYNPPFSVSPKHEREG